MAKRARRAGARRPVDATPVEEAARVAERLSTPTVTSTRAGLPRRVPAAHLVPGAFSGDDEPAVNRSAEEVRSRLEEHQDGLRRARRAASG